MPLAPVTAGDSCPSPLHSLGFMASTFSWFKSIQSEVAEATETAKQGGSYRFGVRAITKMCTSIATSLSTKHLLFVGYYLNPKTSPLYINLKC